MYELIRVGQDNLIGEIIRLEGNNATIQVHNFPQILGQLTSRAESCSDCLVLRQRVTAQIKKSSSSTILETCYG